MRLVVGRVEILAIPAGREEDLSANTIRAASGRQVVRLGPWRTIVIEAGKVHSGASKVGSVIALEGIASDHTEALRESLEVHVGLGTLEVVDKDTAILLDSLELSLLVFVVQDGSPVVGKVLRNSARSASRFASLGVVLGESKPVSTNDLMDVTTDLARRNDRVDTLGNYGSTAAHAEESLSRSGKKGSEPDG